MMKMPSFGKKVLFRLFLLAAVAVLLWDNVSLRAKLNDIHETEAYIAQYDWCPDALFEMPGGEEADFLKLLVGGRAGDVGCQYRLGVAELAARFGENDDRDEKWLDAAAPHLHYIVQAEIAEWFAKHAFVYKMNHVGRKPTSRLGKAFHWHEVAARSGWAPSMERLGHYYLTGFACRKDLAAAEEWFNKALAHRDDEELHNFGKPDDMVAACEEGLAQVYILTGRREQAYDLLRREEKQGNIAKSLLRAIRQAEDAADREPQD